MLTGNGGNDTLFGYGNDPLRGGGNDKLYGGPGRDTLLGGSGEICSTAASRSTNLKAGALRAHGRCVRSLLRVRRRSDTTTEKTATPADTDELVFQDLVASDVTFRSTATTPKLAFRRQRDHAEGPAGRRGVEVIFANGEQLDAPASSGRRSIVDRWRRTIRQPRLPRSLRDPVRDILGNDTDADLDTLSISAVSNALGGTAELSPTA